MKKRSWLLFILIAVLWWLNFYTKRRKTQIRFLPNTAVPRPSLKEIETKEKALKEKLITQAQKVFFEETGRKAKDTNEIIKQGLLSRESVSP